MKKFILYTFVVFIVSILPNTFIGLIRLGVNDFIPYTINYKLFQSRYARYMNDSVHKSFESFKIIPVGDLNNEPFVGAPINRSLDYFGFSNKSENRQPEILFIGDSFFNDPNMNTSMGIQSMVNKRLGKNIAYNIGNVGLCGFKVYNTLQRAYFNRKPNLIIFESVERNVLENLKRSLDELKNQEKYSSFNHSIFDLILGNNFINIKKSNLLSPQTASEKLGKARIISNKNIWFYNNKINQLSRLEMKQIIILMKEIQSFFLREKIHVVFIVAPDKESVYPEIFGNSSLMLLQERMKSEGVKNINIFKSLIGRGNECYYRGDTHWNQSAISILADSVVHQFNQMGY